ncbi:acyl-CoA carboxylase subunit epsilon [Saccharopolyspora taberi]|uniref:Acyl-CoA carboxylase subunit epsilon n=1 Tax=Saccharopolyspora taberi TaxID=60895 RepID=A0ABN3VDP1_9PSEU
MSDTPVLRIVSGDPDDEEIAAVAIALSLAARQAPEPETRREWSVWGEPALRHPAGRRPLRPGPHAWRTSALPY